jgi:hypothetical protein
VTDCFQDGRRRHVGNSSAYYKIGNYHPILMEIGEQTKIHMLSSNITEAEVYGHFSRWPPLPSWKGKFVLSNGQLSLNYSMPVLVCVPNFIKFQYKNGK